MPNVEPVVASGRTIAFTVLVAALGYFVDIYDLILFSIVRVASLKSLGVPADQLLNVGVRLINSQMIGMLLGGILWGILGDKKGRVSVLFGSILLYSLANIANGFVTSVPMYAALRFVAGIGLAGELGAAVTLVSEIMSAKTRGYGTTIVAGVGICGAVVAALVGDAFTWQTAYFIGGALGLCLLALRLGTLESGLFHQTVASGDVRRGDLRMLLAPAARVRKYLACILIGVPIWFAIGVFVTFSPEFAKELSIVGPVTASSAVLYCYVGLAVGDVASGLLSQWLRSRRKAVAVFVALNVLACIAYASCRGAQMSTFYYAIFFLGFANGYWAVFVTMAAEQFGTNLRATVATTAPNFVRGSVVVITLSFRELSQHFSLINSALMVGAVCIVVAALALLPLRESFATDLNYLET